MITPSWLDRREYPFASHYLAVAAGRMHYVDEGRGSPVVMVHGNPTWSFLYRHLIKRLAPDYRCIAPDHLGFGLSDKPWNWNYLPQLHAANLTALIDDLDLRDITLVVQDWGGPIGLAYAVTHPEKIARLVILNTWAWPVNRDPYYVAFSGFVGGPIGRFLIRRFNFFAREIMPTAFGDRSKLTPAAHAQYLYPLADPRDRTGCLVFPKQIVGATPWLKSIWSNIGKLQDKPVQIVWGMQDIAFRAQELRRWEEAFPHARARSSSAASATTSRKKPLPPSTPPSPPSWPRPPRLFSRRLCLFSRRPRHHPPTGRLPGPDMAGLPGNLRCSAVPMPL